jgi:hypothetical protein
MNFIIRLAKSNRFNTILSIVDRLSRMVYFISIIDEIDYKALARLFRDKIFRL